MLYKASKYLTFVVYEDQKATKCFEVKKARLKWLFMLLPIITMIGVGMGVYSLVTVKKKVLELEKQRPAELQSLVDQLNKALDEKKELTQSNTALLNKLRAPSEDNPLILPLVQTVNGFKDLRNKKILELNNFRFEKSADQIKCSFDLINKVESDKTSGYVFAILKAGSKIQIYPEQDLPFEKALTIFDKGERFTVSRFRPVEAVFKLPPKAENYSVQIYVFSRLGDLILQTQKGPISR